VVTKHSQATREYLSCLSNASRTVSEIASQTLSGCPSETDSDVKRYLIEFLLLIVFELFMIRLLIKLKFGRITNINSFVTALHHSIAADNGFFKKRTLNSGVLADDRISHNGVFNSCPGCDGCIRTDDRIFHSGFGGNKNGRDDNNPLGNRMGRI